MKKIPGVDMSTGSLGQGISAAVGMALGAKIDKADWKTYVLLGDGELQEGLVWEAAMSAAHYKLDNLIAFVDNNNLQIDGAITDVMSPYPIDEKFAAFGWNVINIADGNDFEELREGLEKAYACQEMCIRDRRELCALSGRADDRRGVCSGYCSGVDEILPLCGSALRRGLF